MPEQVPYHKADLSKISTEELEKALDRRELDPVTERRVQRILRDRNAAPDRTIQLWILAVAIAALVATLLHLTYDLAY